MPAHSNGRARSKLYLRTLDLLRNRPRNLTLEIVAADADVPKHWLSSLLRNKHMSPGIDRMERLYEYLSNNQLHVP